MRDMREDPQVQQMRLAGCLAFTLLLLALCVLPFLFVDLARRALENLHLSPTTALVVLLALILGSAINIPITRFPLDREVLVPVIDPVGGWPIFPRHRRLRQETTVAINVGGCVIPVLLAIWLLQHIVSSGAVAVGVVTLGVILNTLICYWMAQPIPQVGIAMSPFASPLTALAATWLGFPILTRLSGEPLEAADLGGIYAPVAFVIGIAGPLLGADLLHWRDFKKLAAGTISIGGAGTWDGIVLSGLAAALLA